MIDEPKESTFGEIIDRLGVAPRMDDGDMVTDVIVIAKVIEADGNVRMTTAWNDGIGLFEKTGMLRIAMLGDETGYHSPGRSK